MRPSRHFASVQAFSSTRHPENRQKAPGGPWKLTFGKFLRRAKGYTHSSQQRLCILPFSGETTDPSVPYWRKCRTLNAHLVFFFYFIFFKSRGIDVGVRENQRRAQKLQRTNDWNEKTRKKVVQVKKERDQPALICFLKTC